MTTKITSASDITISPSGLENAVIVEQDGDLQLKKDVRLPNNQSVVWRDVADGSDMTLAVDTSNDLKYNSLTLVSSALGLIPLASIENGGGGGGSGFSLQLTTTSLTAASNTHYLTDTSVGPITITLPSGVAQNAIRFSDDQRTWGLYPLTIVPAAGQSLDGFAANEPLICDLTGAYLQLSWDGSRWVIDSNVVLGGASGGGSSNAVSRTEKSYVTRPDNANADWVSSNTSLVLVGTETVSGYLPESSTKSSAIRITRVSGTTGYVRYRMVLDPTDLGKTLKIQWAQRFLGTTGDYEVEVWGFSASDYTTGALKLPVKNATIPGGGSANFISAFDSNSNLKYVELRIEALSGSTPLYISGVMVGPGVLVQGAVVSGETSYSPVIGGLGSAVLAVTEALYYRIGEIIHVRTKFQVTTAGSGAANITIGLPPGLTPVAIAESYLGTVQKYTGATTSFAIHGFVSWNSSNIIIYKPGSAATLKGSDLVLNDFYYIEFQVKVAEWAGQGTVSILPGAQPVYAFNSSTTLTSDTSSFGYGEDGAILQAFVSTGSVTTNKRVRSPYPNPKFANIQIRYTNTTQWVDVGSTFMTFSFNETATQWYGMDLQPIPGTGTDYDVRFCSQVYPGAAWSTQAGGTRWRVVFSDTSAAVGLPTADLTTTGVINTTSQNIAGDKTFVASTAPVAVFKRSVGGTAAIAFKTADDITRAIVGASTTAFTFLDGTGTSTYGSYAHTTGAWTLGDTSTLNNRHTFNGGISVLSARSRFIANSEPFAVALKYNNAGNEFYLGTDTSSNLQFSAAGGATLGGITQAGSWTMGPTSYAGSHIVNGNILLNNAGFSLIAPNTLDGADNKFIAFGGGGSATEQRGAYALLFGNETGSAQGGNIQLISGSSADSAGGNQAIRFYGSVSSGSGSTQHSYITGDGQWVIGATSSAGIRHIMNGGTNGTAENNYVLRIRNVGAPNTSTSAGAIVFMDTNGDAVGGIVINPSANTVAFNTSSDARLKTNLEEFSGLQIISQIAPKKYERFDAPGTKEHGLIAQQLHSVHPEAVTVGGEDARSNPWSVDYAKLTPVLIRAVQELKDQNQSLRDELEELRTIVLLSSKSQTNS